MLTVDEAKHIVHGQALGNRECVLVMLAIQTTGPLSVQTIRDRCIATGLRKLAGKNISQILGDSVGYVARTAQGWELQQKGTDYVRELAHAVNVSLVVTHSSKSLRKHADAINDTLTRSFVTEAISCFEANQYRAAVVFAWAGAIALLHQHVFARKLTDFNTEAARRDSRWRTARQQDDLGRMKEYEFLDVCEAIGVIGKNVKQVLQNECLVLRNACGHPNSLAIAENSVAAHIEKLIKNVFARF